MNLFVWKTILLVIRTIRWYILNSITSYKHFFSEIGTFVNDSTTAVELF